MDLDVKILAHAISEKRIALNLQTLVSADYFHPNYQAFYKLFVACFNKFHEVPTPRVMEEQGAALWNEEMVKIYSDALLVQTDAREFPADLEILKERHNTNLLLNMGKEIFRKNLVGGNRFQDLQSANATIKKFIAGIDSIYGKKVFKEGSLSITALEAWNDYKAIRDNPDLAKGMHLGLREFDRITNGLQPGELMLIAGESSSGKSALSMQMGLNAWRGSNVIPDSPDVELGNFVDNGANVLVVSIEMPYKSLRRRVDASLAGVPLYGLRDGTLTADEVKRFQSVLKFQKAYNKQFHIVDIPRDCTMAQLESKYIEVCHDFEPNLVIIDYISLMRPDKEQGSDWLNVGRLGEQMHEFCRTYNIAVISPVQLNRPKTNKNGDLISPDQNRTGRSLMLPQNANILLIIETRKEEYLKPDMKVIIGKMRDGEKGAFILHKRLDMMRIYDDVSEWNPEIYEDINGEQ